MGHSMKWFPALQQWANNLKEPAETLTLHRVKQTVNQFIPTGLMLFWPLVLSVISLVLQAYTALDVCFRQSNMQAALPQQLLSL